MINQYELIYNNNIPVINIVTKYNVNNKNKSLKSTVNILNKLFNLNKAFVEKAFIVCYNDQSDIIGIFNCSIGNTTSCYFYNNIIGTCLLLSGSSRFAIFHNHTHGNSINPSEGDFNCWKSANQLGELLRIPLIDSIIVNDNKFYLINKMEEYNIE